MALRTRITELLGIEHPIVQGGMMWWGGRSLPLPCRTPAAWGCSPR